jgi:hypothetical protein
MRVVTEGTPELELRESVMRVGLSHDGAPPWLVDWSAVWAGALAALAAALIFGLVAIAIGAHQLGPSDRIVKWSDFSLGALIFGVLGAFLSFVCGGWVAGKIAGFSRAETASLHGGIVWLVAIPLLLVLAALGAGSYFGSWYGGLAGTPAWVQPSASVDPNAAVVARNSALGSVTALLLGLVGAVLGGWLASGEPMTLTYRRKTLP